VHVDIVVPDGDVADDLEVRVAAEDLGVNGVRKEADHAHLAL
jgi:hypothetical protein